MLAIVHAMDCASSLKRGGSLAKSKRHVQRNRPSVRHDASIAASENRPPEECDKQELARNLGNRLDYRLPDRRRNALGLNV